MRIVIVVTRVPHPRGKGDAKVAFECAEALVADGHEVVIVDHSGEWSSRRALTAALSVPFSRLPAQLLLTRSAALRERVKAALATEPDVLIAVHARAALHIPRSWWPRCFLVLVDAFGRNYRSYRGRVPGVLDLVYRIEARRMTRFDAEATRLFARVGVVSRADARHLREDAGSPERVVHLPQVVDAEYFAATDRGAPSGPTFAFVGRLNYLPNRQAVCWLIEEIWPRLRALWPKVRLQIAGANPPSRLATLVRASGAEMIPNPADIRPILGGATAMLIPMCIGGGVQNKVLEAMAARVPVVATPFSNEGIGAAAGEHLLLAATPEEFQQQCERVVVDPELAAAMARRAHDWVRTHHAMSNLAQALIPECRQLASVPVRVTGSESSPPRR